MAEDMLSEPQEEPARVRPFDWPWDVDEIIWPCRRCTSWRAELILEGPDSAIWIREWHADDCAIWVEVDGLDA